MLQELFHIPFFNIPIYGYGVMLVIGFLAAIQLAKFLATRAGLDPELFVNAGLIALLTGVAGARISHVIENIGYYTNPNRSFAANLFDAINIRSGGLTYYGGFLLAFPSLILYARAQKMPLRLSMDIVAPCLMIGLAFGRVGCFLNGCCYGATCDLPWAVTFPYYSIPYREEVDEHKIIPPAELTRSTVSGRIDVLSPGDIHDHASELPPDTATLAAQQHSLPLHPAQLYSTITAFLIAAVVVCFLTLPHAPGRGFALMMTLEGLTRYLLECLRVEPPVIGDLSLSMVLGLALMLLGIILWFVFGQLSRSMRPSNWAPAPNLAPAPT
jgi:phosphatidylglycerol:prolipoprotein diacylglycerol transferase